MVIEWLKQLIAHNVYKLDVKSLHGLHPLSNLYHSSFERVTGIIQIFTDEKVESLKE